jgi:hypothetical protein
VINMAHLVLVTGEPVRYGEPVRLDLTDGPIDLGTETAGGERIIRLVLGDGAADAALSPAEARQLATELTRLADAP